MRFVLTGDSDCPIARLALSRGESVKIENGSMVYSRGVEISGGLNSKKKGLGGVLGAIGRSITSGESMFITTATGTVDDGEIAIAPPIPGKIISLQVGGQQQYRLNTGAFLACDATLDYTMVNQGLGRAVFGGTGGLFVMETNGTGTILVSAFGDILSLDVTPESPLVVDNEHVVAWDASLNYNIQVASGMFGFTTGEGVVNSFNGYGRVYIQTRNLQNLAQAMHPYLPTSAG
ncbi:MAG TPA: TIGR00266 family protein [Candidatus Aphodovivens avicola]|nr:TIGR00266 family protein [Candidatus Aphodovivens avicola]